MTNETIAFDCLKKFLENFLGCKILGIEKWDYDGTFINQKLWRYITLNVDHYSFKIFFSVKLPEELKFSEDYRELERYFVDAFLSKSRNMYMFSEDHKVDILKISRNWVVMKDSSYVKSLVNKLLEDERKRIIDDMWANVKISELIDMSESMMVLRMSMLGI